MRRNRLRLFGAMTVSILAAASLARAQPLFQGLGLPSNPTAVNADGTVVVGTRGNQAVRWTASGVEVLGHLPGGTSSFPRAVNADGSVIVGHSSLSGGVTEAFRWTSGVGMEGLGDLPGGNTFSSGRGVSADGAIVVGDAWSSLGIEAFRWTSATQMQSLLSQESSAAGISADGSVIVGRRSTTEEPFRWTASAGAVGLGFLGAPGVGVNDARGVSADGATVVGVSRNEAFRWTAGSGMQGLGFLPGWNESSATAANATGSVIVGRNFSSGPSLAFIWDAANGMRSVQTMLQDELGLNLGGWSLDNVADISADGSTIVGTGINPQGEGEGWRAVIRWAGISQDFPVLPTSTTGGGFQFEDVSSGQWFDPPAVDAFDYTMTSASLFSDILDFPTGFNDVFTVSVGGITLGSFGPGQSVTFSDFAAQLGALLVDGEGVASFRVSGISPLVDAEDPLAFPLQIAFNTPTASFQMTVVPEPMSLAAFGVVVLTMLRRRSG